MNSIREKVIKKKKYRRKKKVLLHANPLFDKWLSEWQVEAADLGSNMKYNYQRARMSLKKYPLAVYRGSECKILAHFGDKICQMLDKRLEKHVQENGPVDWDEIHKIMRTPAAKKIVRKKKTAPKQTHPVEESDPDSPSTPSQNGKGRAYVPAYRSGGYALLVTLYYSHKENQMGCMKKAELMEAAQPLCNGSFTQAPEGSHYTAWSSMSTLIKKDLIRREGCPSRYTITSKGKTLGAKLVGASQWDALSTSRVEASQEGTPITNSVISSQRKASTTDYVNPSQWKTSTSTTSVDIVTLSSRSCSPFSITSSPEKPNKDKLNLSPESDSLLNRVSKNNRSKPSRTNGYESNTSRATKGKDNVAKRKFDSGFVSEIGTETTSSSDLPEGNTDKLKEADIDISLKKKQKTLTSSPSSSIVRGNSYDKIFLSSSLQNSAASSSSIISRESSYNKISPLSSLPKSIESVTSIKKFCTDFPISHQPFSLLTGMYDIVLCVDNCETKGGFQGASKFSTKDIIINELTKHKITYDVRKLHIGDFLWVVRERNKSQPKELVLPYIVERKRMDDLAKSIRDGRFKEQKYRLKQCGLYKPVYLVEQYGSQNLNLPESTCLQAVTNTQIVDGFTVKITKDQQESAAFLTIMTRCLQSRYQGKTVRSLTIDDLQNQEDPINNTVETLLMTFSDLNTYSMKNHQLPVREMFAKHLLQLHGLSVDKAKAVVEKYGTPASLISAYEDLDNPMESEQMLASLRCGKAGRNLGPALSMNIAKLYTNLMLK